MVGRPPMRIRKLIVGAIVSASMLIAAPAFAQTASEGYSTPAGSIQERISTERTPNPRDPGDEITETRAAEESRSELPFTGLDVALIIGAGGLLLAMGLGMRRLSRAEVA
jgi:hypothetical protein